MKVFCEELTDKQRAGGIETATQGLVTSLLELGTDVVRSSQESDRSFRFRPDCVHIHGIWSPTLARRWIYWRKRNVPCVVTVHGMLEPWALEHKRFKKAVAWNLYQRYILNRVSVLHATSDREADNLKRLGLKTRIETIPWGIDLPEHRTSFEHSSVSGIQRTALFVGRIYPVKGLPMLVEAWAKVRPAGWKMRIVGPDEAGHRAGVASLVRQFKLDADFEFVGAMEGEDLRRAYEDADLFILPSHSENFGMVIGDALSHGLPVITTRGTPWDGLVAHQCGWWTSISGEGIAAALAEATAIDDDSRHRMGNRGRQWIASDFSWKTTAKKMIELYKNAVTS